MSAAALAATAPVWAVASTTAVTVGSAGASAALSTGGTESRAAIVATGIAQLTGLAISPLLVLVAIGWTDYALVAADGALPLHANPWFLIPCSVALALALLKKSASPAIPLPVRKLLDAAEYLEAKLSALVAAGVLLPTIVGTMSGAVGGDAAGAQTAGFTGEWATLLWLAPAMLVLFGAVWITFHAVDALIVLSPFALLDTALALGRFLVLAVIGLALVVSPFLALALCAPIILACLLVAGWCVRLDLFALCVAKDILGSLISAPAADLARPRAFLARRGLGAPIRTMGHAEPDAADVRFTYRPFFVLPRRTLVIPARSPEIVHGAVWPTLVEGAQGRGIVSFPPRYRARAAELADRFGARLRDGRIRAGFRRLRESARALRAMLAGESTVQG